MLLKKNITYIIAFAMVCVLVVSGVWMVTATPPQTSLAAVQAEARFRTTQRDGYAQKYHARSDGANKDRQDAQYPSALDSIAFDAIGNVLANVEIAAGIKYWHIITTRGHHSVRVVAMDRAAGASVQVCKALNRADGLELLAEMAARMEQESPTTLKCLVNANLWSALGSTPIGPTVVDGEVVEMPTRKQWSSCFFDRSGRMVIDRFRLQGAVKMPSGASFALANVNRRSPEDEGVVLYNRYAGRTVPAIGGESTGQEEQQKQARQETAGGSIAQTKDSTDITPRQEDLKRFNTAQQRAYSDELQSWKIVATYKKQPVINEVVPCTVVSVTTGLVSLPPNGVVISLGKSWPAQGVEAEQQSAPPASSLAALPKAGQAIALHFSTSIHTQTAFKQAVCGTPRLVRDGLAVQEAETEGVTSKRFMEFRLPRTAIGANRNGTTIFFVVVDGRESDTNAATLQEMAELMRSLGAHDALNLDGGGSSSMIVLGRRGERSERVGGLVSARKVSVMLGAVVKANAQGIHTKQSNMQRSNISASRDKE